MSHDDDVGFLYKTMIERDPKKRRVKPVETAPSLLDFDLGESSDDSDFRIEDHCDESDDDSVDTNEENKDDGNNDDDDSDSDESEDDDPVLGKKNNGETTNVGDIIEKAKQQAEKGQPLEDKLSRMLICCGCLGERSDDVNEIVECDGCGVTVHEGCYGVSDVESFSSADSLSQSAPWFCEVCSAGVEDPDCELCPNKGGIFKETDVGKWVHLVCALYVPGVAFGEVDRLTSVTLFEMTYNKWGAKACTLCEDVRYARTGVCIECDAGMCNTYFHVTCAQREGLLSEAHSEEVDQADPFYAHCKLHSDKALVRKRKRHWLALRLRATYRSEMLKKPEYRATEEFQRIQRKLAKHRNKYLAHKATKPPPWVPTQKMPRLLTTSASACRNFYRKAELMGIDTKVLETQEEQMASLVDIRKKWHIPPAFSVEFVSYYLDRKSRSGLMKTRLEELLVDNSRLLSEQQELDKKYDETMKINEEQVTVCDDLRLRIEIYHRVLKAIGYSKPLPAINEIAKPKTLPPLPSTPSIATIKAASQNSNYNNTDNQSSFDIGDNLSTSIATSSLTTATTIDANHKIDIPQVRHQCGICRRSTNQHLLAKCDTCQLHYHLDCLTPPLTRMPKKTKLMGWQCSECDKESSDSDIEMIDTSAPRRLRHCKDESNNFAGTTIIEEALVHKPPLNKIRKLSESKNTSASTIFIPQSTPSLTITPIPPIKMVPVLQAKDQEKSTTNLHNNSNSLSNNTNNILSLTPKIMIKPMVSLLKKPESPEIEEVYYNHNSINNVAPIREGTPEYRLAPVDGVSDKISGRSGKKRRREKHKRYSPDPITGIKQRKRKHKRKSFDVENPENHTRPEIHRRITIKIKPIPLPEGEVPSASNPQLFVASSTSTAMTPPPLSSPLQLNKSPTDLSMQFATSTPTQPSIVRPPEVIGGRRVSGGNNRRSKEADVVADCTVCNSTGNGQNSVICDECKRCYHFTCLDPPVKKTPKRRGYSWHCADCDPSASEPEN